MNEPQKTVGEVFRDYEKENKIKQAHIININMYKKLNKLEMNLKADELLSAKELSDFETYLQNRFNIENTELIIDYSEIQKQDNNTEDLKKTWEEILLYLSKKYPMAKAILKNSKLKHKCIINIKN